MLEQEEQHRIITERNKKENACVYIFISVEGKNEKRKAGSGGGPVRNPSTVKKKLDEPDER